MPEDAPVTTAARSGPGSGRLMFLNLALGWPWLTSITDRTHFPTTSAQCGSPHVWLSTGSSARSG